MIENPKWHLTKEEIQEVIRKEKKDDPNPQPFAMYLAILQAQKRKQEEAEQRFVRSLVTGELKSLDYFDGQITSVTGLSKIPSVFEEAFNNKEDNDEKVAD